MAYNPNKDLKQFYSIVEVAEMFNVKPSLLRYWEQKFPHLKPKTVGRDVRKYTKADIEKVRVVYDLVKVRGLKLDKAAELLKKNPEGAVQTSELLNELQNIRKELVEIRDNLSAEKQ